ncbi:MAG: bacillithiol biosynthesis deacetylase BshB1 [Gemmatimonadaceae bacterium]|nr:bacillithiol biosynthesis deacetylase BshB1 [Gemmatimonadaceae bacterium]
MLDILAIMAHPDDVELTCGGTLAAAADRGRRVGIVDLTRGETASRGTPELRATEAQAAARILGVEHRECLGLPDAAIVDVPATRERLARVLRTLQPQVVITHARTGRHPDHEAAAQLVRNAAFIAGLRMVAPDLPPFRPRKVLHCTTYREDAPKPTFVVDISATFDRKLAAIACYRSQFEGLTQAGEVYPNGEPLADVIRHQAAHYGAMIRCRYGEPFFTTETMRVEDVAALDVPTF